MNTCQSYSGSCQQQSWPQPGASLQQFQPLSGSSLCHSQGLLQSQCLYICSFHHSQGHLQSQPLSGSSSSHCQNHHSCCWKTSMWPRIQRIFKVRTCKFELFHIYLPVLLTDCQDRCMPKPRSIDNPKTAAPFIVYPLLNFPLPIFIFASEASC